MSYTLDAFCRDCHAALAADTGPGGREQVRRDLERLLAEPGFLDEHVLSQPPGRHTLYEDPELGFVVLAHVNPQAGKSPPHDHGASWAVYGQATQYTEMTEYDRMDDGSDATHGQLKIARKYRLSPGEAGIFQDGKIHSIDYPAKSCFVRVTGTNLDRIPRIMFDPKSGKITRMMPQQAT